MAITLGKGRWVPELCIASRICSCAAMWDSPKVPTRGFSAKKEGVWHNLSNMPQILYFLCLPIFQCHVVQIKHSLMFPWDMV